MKTVLVTGANSGIGLETAYQLAKAGYDRVVLGCRTHEKGEAARTWLLARGAPDVFEVLAVDVAEVPSSVGAADDLVKRGHRFDLVILNAGTASGNRVVKNADGVELTFASTLIGHHALTMRLLAHEGIADDGRILIAGSEASRGDVMAMKIPDLDAIARADFAGNAHEMLTAFARGTYPSKYDGGTAYAMAKLFAAWWAAELAPRLPKNMAVYAVSPGNTPTTGMGRDLPWPIRTIVLPTLGVIGPFLGMAHSVETASHRYLAASRFGTDRSGKFFASPAKKLTGDLVEQHTHWLDDRAMQATAYAVINELTDARR